MGVAPGPARGRVTGPRPVLRLRVERNCLRHATSVLNIAHTEITKINYHATCTRLGECFSCLSTSPTSNTHPTLASPLPIIDAPPPPLITLHLSCFGGSLRGRLGNGRLGILAFDRAPRGDFQRGAALVVPVLRLHLRDGVRPEGPRLRRAAVSDARRVRAGGLPVSSGGTRRPCRTVAVVLMLMLLLVWWLWLLLLLLLLLTVPLLLVWLWWLLLLFVVVFLLACCCCRIVFSSSSFCSSAVLSISMSFHSLRRCLCWIAYSATFPFAAFTRPLCCSYCTYVCVSFMSCPQANSADTG